MPRTDVGRACLLPRLPTMCFGIPDAIREQPISDREDLDHRCYRSPSIRNRPCQATCRSTPAAADHPGAVQTAKSLPAAMRTAFNVASRAVAFAGNWSLTTSSRARRHRLGCPLGRIGRGVKNLIRSSKRVDLPSGSARSVSGWRQYRSSNRLRPQSPQPRPTLPHRRCQR